MDSKLCWAQESLQILMMIISRRGQGEDGEAGGRGQERRGGLQQLCDGPGDRAVLRGQGAQDFIF